MPISIMIMNLFKTLKDIWNIEELRQKILLTLGLVAVYRFMAGVPLPGIDPNLQNCRWHQLFHQKIHIPLLNRISLYDLWLP